jgi:acyl-CoA synthetase (AMP-forming)/AMP-acid ligase II
VSTFSPIPETAAPTLGALLERQAAERPDHLYVQLLQDDGTERRITFADQAAGARRVAAAFQGLGLAPGFRVLIVLPTGVEFLDTFYGTVLAGGVAIPAYPPLRTKGLAEYQERLARLIACARPDVVLTFAKIKLVVEAATFAARVPARVLEPAALVPKGAFQPVAVAPDDLALVQFSSGSTGDPRGVMLSHRNLLANVAAVLAVLQPDETDVNCSWLPLYHDMGLIGGLFMPLHCGRPVVLLSPQGFLLDPKRWLWAIHHHRATISTAPNFAYQLIAGRVDERELAGLDLSCWRLALCGAEPVMPETLAAFARKLAPHGFREEGLLPVYGLAEVALGALFPVPGQPFRRDGVDPAALEAHGRAEPGGRVLSSVGRPLLTMAGVAGAGIAGAVYHSLSTPYQRARWEGFMNPWGDPTGGGYQLVQSLMAIGSGGILGEGWGQSKQKLFYLPIQYADFIFAVLAEEMGLVGSISLLLLFLVLAWRGFAIAGQARDPFHALLAIGLTTTVVAQALINIGVVTASLPTTGIPLPFLSFGGTSLLATLFSMGLILNVSRHTQRHLQVVAKGAAPQP